jgi:hypothetical protein
VSHERSLLVQQRETDGPIGARWGRPIAFPSELGTRGGGWKQRQKR